MATRLEKMTPKQYEWAFMKLVEMGAPIEYKEALTRDFGRDYPEEYRAFRKAYRAGQIKLDDYIDTPEPAFMQEEDIFESFLVGFLEPLKPITEPIMDLIGYDHQPHQPVTLKEQVAFGTGSLVTLVLVLLLLLLTVWHKIVRWMKL